MTWKESNDSIIESQVQFNSIKCEIQFSKWMEYYFHDYRIDFDKKHSSNVRMAEAQQEYSFSSKILITDNYFMKLKTTARSTKKQTLMKL